MSGSQALDSLRARLARLDRVRDRMSVLGVDALVLSLGADLPWLCGYEAMPLERPTALVVPSGGQAELFVPELEAPRVREESELFTLMPWKESEDPIARIAGAVGSAPTVAVSDRMWASLLLSLQEQCWKSRFVPASTVTGPLRAVKDSAEVAALMAAGAAADRVARSLLAGEIPLVGRSEREVSESISRRLLEEGHHKVNFAIVGSGPNSASPHHEPGERRIRPGDAVVCDFGGAFPTQDDVAYCSDTTRTLCVGEPPERFVELYSVLADAQARAVAAVRPGVRAQEVDATARQMIAQSGFGDYFIHRTGHGIGIEEHEAPYIVAGNELSLVSGHAFSVEPGIYLPGTMGARIEDIVVVSEQGVSVCNDSPHELVVLER